MSEKEKAIEWLKLYMQNRRIGNHATPEFFEKVDLLIETVFDLQQQLQAYKDKEDKLRELIVEPCANVLGHDILQILDGSDE